MNNMLIMKEIDYKEIDRKSILEYIEKQGGQCPVQDIIKDSGAEKLRVYPILFEEVQSARLTVMYSGRYPFSVPVIPVHF